MASLDLEVLRHALTIARERGYAEVEVADGDDEFKAKLEPTPRRSKPAAVTPEEGDPAEPELLIVKATQVGYYRPSENPLSVGRKVAKGDIVAVISALGLANDVEANVEGEVVQVLVQDGDPVQFGQALAQVKP
jgi:acetyl-CoA carboxylase biotin carboxyl carrier protein